MLWLFLPSIFPDFELAGQSIELIFTEVYTQLLENISELLLGDEPGTVRIHIHKLFTEVLPHIVNLRKKNNSTKSNSIIQLFIW